MFEQIILGIIQGIAEWLPVSSEGSFVLIKTNFFGNTQSIVSVIQSSLFLHLGTFFAALIYFRREVVVLAKALFNFSTATDEAQKTLRFLVISTFFSGLLGVLILKTLTAFEGYLDFSGPVISLMVGIALLISGFLQLKAKEHGIRKQKDLIMRDGIILGFAQGFAALPGLSRSGLTVASLLLLKFDKACALRLSFLMSLPIVLAGNIILNANQLILNSATIAGLLFSFIFGLATIHLLLKLAQKINFGYFVIFFGILTIIAAIV